MINGLNQPQCTNEDIPTMQATSSINHSLYNIEDTNHGPLTQSHVKKIQEKVNSFLTEIIFSIFENVIVYLRMLYYLNVLTNVLISFTQGAITGPNERRWITQKLNNQCTWMTTHEQL